jgi:hypothetical protein
VQRQGADRQGARQESLRFALSGSPLTGPKLALSHVMADEEPGLGTILLKIGQDFKTIIVDETELGRAAIAHELKISIEKVAIALLAAIMALIGLGLLCVTAVIALEPVIWALWLRMLIMSVVYLATGAIGVWRVAKYHSAKNIPMEEVVADARGTFVAIEHGLKD